MRKFFALFLVLALCFAQTGCGSKDRALPPVDITDPVAETEEEPNPGDSAEPGKKDGIQTVTAGPEDLVALVADAKGIFSGYINTRGQWVIAPDYLAGTQFSNGLAAVCTRGKDSHWQIIDKSGAVLVDCEKDVQFVPGAHFCEGLMQIRNEGYSAFGFANTQGEIIVPPIYQKVEDYREGLAAVQKDGLWGYVDTLGTEVIPCQYQVAHSFSCGRAYICYEVPEGISRDGDAFIDKTGRIVFEDIGIGSDKLGFEQYSSDFYGGVALCLCLNDRTIGRGAGLVNDAGVIAWYDKRQEYFLPSTYRLAGEDLFCIQVRAGNQQGFIDASGTLVCTVPDGYKLGPEEFSGFKDGLCTIREVNSGFLGYMDNSGQVVIPAIYQDLGPFRNSYAVVSKGGATYFYIDKSGAVAASGDYTCLGNPFTK